MTDFTTIAAATTAFAVVETVFAEDSIIPTYIVKHPSNPQYVLYEGDSHKQATNVASEHNIAVTCY